jgi:hypothetical protein
MVEFGGNTSPEMSNAIFSGEGPVQLNAFEGSQA